MDLFLFLVMRNSEYIFVSVEQFGESGSFNARGLSGFKRGMENWNIAMIIHKYIMACHNIVIPCWIFSG